MPITWATIWRVFLGGALGTMLRFALMILLESQFTALMVINLVGTAFLGFANASSKFESQNAGAFWKIGVAGGFTTLSGLALAISPSQPFTVITAILMMISGVVVYLVTKRESKNVEPA